MNNELNRYSLTRVWHLLKHYAVVERSTYIIYTVISIITIQIPYIIAVFCYYDEKYGKYDITFWIELVGSIITLILMFIASSLLMSGTASKEERSNFITTPAKNSEKFTARLLICTIGAYAVLYVSHLLGMFIYCSLIVIMGAGALDCSLATSAIDLFINFLSGSNKGYFIARGLLLMFYTISFFGATVWRHQTVLKNASTVILSFGVPFVFHSRLESFVSLETAQNITIIAIYVVSALFMWLAWRRFCRVQIIEKEPKLWKPVVALLAIYFGTFSLSNYPGPGVIVIEEARLERITGVDFPHYSHSALLYYDKNGYLGDFSTTSMYEFDEHPSEAFYSLLDSLSQQRDAEGYGWRKGTSLRDKKNPQYGNNTEYIYNQSWGNGRQAPKGEDPDADRFIEVRIIKGVRGIKITYGAH